MLCMMFGTSSKYLREGMRHAASVCPAGASCLRVPVFGVHGGGWREEGGKGEDPRKCFDLFLYTRIFE